MEMDVAGRKVISPAEIFCKPCGDDTKRVPANGLCRECEEHMCIACFGNHKKYKMCKDHNLVDINTSVSETSEAKEEHLERCQQHSNEQVKFYCSTHEDVGCGDCMILEHKTCKVKYIRDVSDKFKDSEEYNDIVNHVDSCEKEVKKCSSSIFNNKIQAGDIHLGFIAEIESFRDEINAHLEKMEEELVQKANDVKSTDTLRAKSLTTSCEELEKQLSKIRDDILSKSDEPNELFVNTIRCKRMLKEIEHRICNIMSENKINNYHFTRNIRIQEILEQTDLGQYSIYENYTSRQNTQEYEQPITLQTKSISLQAGQETRETINNDKSTVPESQETRSNLNTCVTDYEQPITLQTAPISVQAGQESGQTINKDRTTLPESQAEQGTRSTLIEDSTTANRDVQIEQATRGTHYTSKQVAQVEPITSHSTNENRKSLSRTSSNSQDYGDPVYEEIPGSKMYRKRGSSKRKHWSLFESQLRCENLLMAGEYISFKDNGNGDIGMFMGKKPIKAGTYLEVEIVSSADNGNIAIGFIPKDYSLKEQPGDGLFSTGYHTCDGCMHDQSKSGKRISSPCKVGDVIGIGASSYLNNVFKTKIGVFFTRNRQKIGALEVNNPSFCKLYPAISLKASGDKARVLLDAQEP